jgi:tRNA threonylcarbamoyladenosine biosynthesis protein TsaB
MRVLALDTTTRSGSVAVVERDRVVEERAGDGSRTHALRLPAEVIAVLEAHALTLAEVDLFAVASGPGSFTGLRIGIATIQGLAFVGGKRVVGVSALEALARAASLDLPPGATIAAVMDAHRREVFTAVYRAGDSDRFAPGGMVEVEAVTVGELARAVDRWTSMPGGPVYCVGDGAVLHADALARILPSAVVLPPPLLAGVIGRMAVRRAADAVAPADLRPVYVRRPDVELARERNASRLP